MHIFENNNTRSHSCRRAYGENVLTFHDYQTLFVYYVKPLSRNSTFLNVYPILVTITILHSVFISSAKSRLVMFCDIIRLVQWSRLKDYYNEMHELQRIASCLYENGRHRNNFLISRVGKAHPFFFFFNFSLAENTFTLVSGAVCPFFGPCVIKNQPTILQQLDQINSLILLEVK